MSVLERVLAQKFIDKTKNYLEYNINIMNDKGIIIASKDPSRIGDFHEVASGMLDGTIETGVIKEGEEYLGTKPGVNLFVDYQEKHVGVICVTGDPYYVNSFAGLVKISLETMLEYEIEMARKRRIKNKSEQFLYYLLFEENANKSGATKLADELKFNTDIVRVCIIIKCDSNKNPKNIINLLTSTEGYSHNDIVTVARNGDIIMFKAIDTDTEIAIKNFKSAIDEYCNAFLKKVSKEYDLNKIVFFVGSLQNNISKYKKSYHHAQELALQMKVVNGTYFFNDHILDYYRRLVTIKVHDNIFNVYDDLFSKEDKIQIVEMVEVLNKNNYAVVSSAKVLYIHRNTLLFRLNKLKETLNIDPIAKSEDREFLNELAYYFSRRINMTFKDF